MSIHGSDWNFRFCLALRCAGGTVLAALLAPLGAFCRRLVPCHSGSHPKSRWPAPFPGYVSMGKMLKIAHVVAQVTKHLPGDERRLLDIGCGLGDDAAVSQQSGFTC